MFDGTRGVHGMPPQATVVSAKVHVRCMGQAFRANGGVRLRLPHCATTSRQLVALLSEHAGEEAEHGAYERLPRSALLLDKGANGQALQGVQVRALFVCICR